MKKKFTINLLSKEFYRQNTYKEILTKENRPYLVLIFEINNIRYAIPFRSHIKHKYGYKLKGYKNQKDYAGLDFTKTVILNNEEFIGIKAFIDRDQYERLNSEFKLMYKNFVSFINKYNSIINKKQLNKTEQNIINMSSLKFFYDKERNNH